MTSWYAFNAPTYSGQEFNFPLYYRWELVGFSKLRLLAYKMCTYKSSVTQNALPQGITSPITCPNFPTQGWDIHIGACILSNKIKINMH